MYTNINYSAPVLVVDDQAVMVEVTRAILSKLGFERVEQASDADTALSMLRGKGSYQLVISDLRMEPVNGLQLLRSIRQDYELRDIRFILMTVSGDATSVVAAKQAGADAYHLKPFTPQHVKGKIQEVLSRERQQR